MKFIHVWDVVHSLPLRIASSMQMVAHKFYGRFNQGVVTINLVDVACSSNGDMDEVLENFG